MKIRNRCVVMLCVNDVRGMDLHRVRAVDVEDVDGSMIELESLVQSDDDGDSCYPISYGIGDGHGPRFGALVQIRVGHGVFKATNHMTHVGNLCWDAVAMKRTEVRRLIRYLIVTRKWLVKSAPIVSDLLPNAEVAP